MALAVENILQDRYRIEGFLKRGGMGAVYKAWDMALKVPVAVKENTIEASPKAKEQFEREAQILARLHHPNLPRVTNHFTIADQGQYLIMDFVEGESLSDLLRRLNQPLPNQEALSWIKQVCEALEYLHNQTPPIIHRDIKPQNIIVTPAGQVMLVDFGIAKLYDPHQDTTIGARGITPGYSPLEQYTHDPTDARSDIYALGATLYAILTIGKPPPESIHRRLKDTPVTPPSRLNPAVNSQAEKVILKSLEITTERRYQTVIDFYNDLENTLAVADGKTIKRKEPEQPPSGKAKLLLFAGAAIMLILLVGGVFLGLGLGSTSSTPAMPAIKQSVIEIDGSPIQTDDFQPVACDSSPRLEVKFLAANGVPIEAANFSYNWRFEPDDQYNEDKLNSSNYATIYHVPCELDSQTVIVQAQKDGQTFFTKSLLFDISEK